MLRCLRTPSILSLATDIEPPPLQLSQCWRRKRTCFLDSDVFGTEPKSLCPQGFYRVNLGRAHCGNECGSSRNEQQHSAGNNDGFRVERLYPIQKRSHCMSCSPGARNAWNEPQQNHLP